MTAQLTFNPYSIGFWLTRRNELSPERVAVDFEDRAISYGELNERSNRVAQVLQGAGVRRGDRVAVLSDNRPEYLEVFFACAKLGIILAPVSWRLAEPEIEWQLGDSSPSALFVAPEWADLGRSYSGPVFPFSGTSKGESTYEQALADSQAVEPEDVCGFDDPLMLLYTSGTTGRPKGAVLTHGNFFWTNLNMLVNADLHQDDVTLMFLPMFHIGGWNVNTLSIFWKGGTVVLERQFDASRINALIPKKQITFLMGVPATYLFMSQDPSFESADYGSVRTMVAGGAPMPGALLQLYSERGIDIVQGYGLTELAPNGLILPALEAARKAGSAGKPYFFADTRLMDESGNLLDPPAEGEIVARGPSVMAGYWKAPDATAEAIKDGWLHTGDVGRTDEDGFFYVVDRKKDMIISGGENVYPAEVENAIFEHDAVAEVAVIGVPSERWGESAHAIVVAKQDTVITDREIIEHCESRLARFKVPKSVEIREEPLPRTPAGKVRKPELRRPFWEGRETRI